MSDQYPPPPPPPGEPVGSTPPPPPPAPEPTADAAPPAPAYAAAPPAYGAPAGAPGTMGAGPIGKVRGTGMCILLAIVTLGIYTYVWWYKVHEEMKQHSGQGLGGGMTLLFNIVGGLCLGGIPTLVLAFLTSGEVEKLYGRTGRPSPVKTTTGLWYFPGALIIVGPIVWFVKTNGALNDYWKSLGAQG